MLKLLEITASYRQYSPTVRINAVSLFSETADDIYNIVEQYNLSINKTNSFIAVIVFMQSIQDSSDLTWSQSEDLHTFTQSLADLTSLEKYMLLNFAFMKPLCDEESCCLDNPLVKTAKMSKLNLKSVQIDTRLNIYFYWESVLKCCCYYYY